MGYIGEGINLTRSAVETSKEEFFGTYYGQSSSEPTVDPNGNPITDGDLYYDTSEDALKIRVNGEWLSLRTATTGYQEFTATNGQTTFTMSGSYTPGFVFVTLNGVVLADGDYDDSSGTSIVLTEGAATDDILGVYIFDTFSVADTVPSTGGTFTGPVVFDGDLTVDTDTLFVDSANNRVGVGTTVDLTNSSNQSNNTGITIRGNDGLSVFSSNASLTALFNKNGSDGTIVDFRKDGSTVGTIGVNSSQRLTMGVSDVGLIYQTDTFDYIGPYSVATPGGRDDAINLGFPTNRFKNLYLSGGVYLGGTGSANYLDDYETGTWTPRYFDTRNSFTYDIQEGDYVKIGNRVFLSGRIVLSDSTLVTGNDNAGIEGIPFNCVSSIFVGKVNSSGYSGEHPCSITSNTNNVFTTNSYNETNGSVLIRASDLGGGSTASITFSISYTTDS